MGAGTPERNISFFFTLVESVRGIAVLSPDKRESSAVPSTKGTFRLAASFAATD